MSDIIDRHIIDRLGDGRSFVRAARHPSGLLQAIRISPPLEYGGGYEDAYLSSPEFLITAKQITARHAFADQEPGLGRLVFVFHLQGERIVDLCGTGRRTLDAPSFAVYYQAAGVSKRSFWPAGSQESSVLVGFWPENPPAVLRRLFSHSSDWRSDFGVEGRFSAWLQWPLTLEMERAARLILTPGVHEAILPEFLATKANELLCLGYATVLGASRWPKSREAAITTKLRMVKQLIDRSLRNIPSKSELAHAIGLSPAVLKREFQQAYDQTISEYVAHERMQKARILLASTAMPLKMIAYELGYNHTSNFCLAFRRRFGTTPLQVRREARREEQSPAA
jgi:AraC-like DNA-binding protein